MQQKIKALKAAFPYTIPIMAGFLFLGTAYGILMNSKGFSFWWSLLMSIVIFAGSIQFVSVSLLTSAVFNPVYAFLLTLMVNARHLFYGISMLDKFKDTGSKKPYLIFGMCDETFSVLCATDPPEGVDRSWFMFFITFLNQFYWVLGSTLGGILGSYIAFNIKGIEFVMTALFIVIFIEQWKSQQKHTSSIIGILAPLLCLVVFGPENFILPSMALIIIALTLLQKNLFKGREVE